jgi:hypothetical protein
MLMEMEDVTILPLAGRNLIDLVIDSLASSQVVERNDSGHGGSSLNSASRI